MVKWCDFIINTAMREENQQEYISSFIKRKRWSYIDHVMRKNDMNITQQQLFWVPTKKRNKGRPKETLR
jgi:hypothetical protein